MAKLLNIISPVLWGGHDLNRRLRCVFSLLLVFGASCSECAAAPKPAAYVYYYYDAFSPQQQAGIYFLTVPRRVPYHRNNTFLFSPIEMDRQVGAAIKAYLSVHGMMDAPVTVDLARQEKAVIGSKNVANQTLMNVFRQILANLGSHPRGYPLHVIILNTETGDVVKDEAVNALPKQPAPCCGTASPAY